MNTYLLRNDDAKGEFESIVITNVEGPELAVSHAKAAGFKGDWYAMPPDWFQPATVLCVQPRGVRAIPERRQM